MPAVFLGNGVYKQSTETGYLPQDNLEAMPMKLLYEILVPFGDKGFLIKLSLHPPTYENLFSHT